MAADRGDNDGEQRQAPPVAAPADSQQQPPGLSICLSVSGGKSVRKK